MRFARSLPAGTDLAPSVLPPQGSAQAKTWDLPSAYAPVNFHTLSFENLAEGVNSATGGKRIIKVHSGASFVKATEITRAVRVGQVPIGEICSSCYPTRTPSMRLKVFLANGYRAGRKLGTPQPPLVEKGHDAQGVKLHSWAPWLQQGLIALKKETQQRRPPG